MHQEPDRSVYKSLFDHAFKPLWILDADMVILSANQAAADLVGYALEDLIGQPLTLLLPPEFKKGHGGYVDHYMKGGGTKNVLGKTRQFEIMHASGTRIAIILKAFEMPTDGEAVLFGAMMEDIREKLQFEEQQQALIADLERMARTDALTNIPNRRALLEELDKEAARCRRQDSRASVVVIDLDHFKAINDQYGHDCGDEVLRFVSQILADNLRGIDTFGRLGGEEFAVIMPVTPPKLAANVIERILYEMRDTPFVPVSGEPIRVGFSAGVAALDAHKSGTEALREADTALYRAKALGRARVEIWRGQETDTVAPSVSA